MLLNWNLKYFILGMSWNIIQATEDQVTQPNTTLCSHDTVLLCTPQMDQSFYCTNVSRYMGRQASAERHINKSSEGTFRLLTDIQCDLKFSNCTATRSGKTMCLLCNIVGNHENYTATFKVSDSSELNKHFNEGNQISDIVLCFIVLAAILIMYLSYCCLPKVFHDSTPHIRPILQPQKLETFVNFRILQHEKMGFV